MCKLGKYQNRADSRAGFEVGLRKLYAGGGGYSISLPAAWVKAQGVQEPSYVRVTACKGGWLKVEIVDGLELGVRP